MRTLLRVCAGVCGVVGLAGAVAIALFFTLETSMLGGVPRGDFFGPLSDWLGVVGALPVVLASLLFAARAHAPWWFWVLSVLVAVTAVVSAVVTWLFIEGSLRLDDQFAAAGPQIVVLSAWIACAGVVGARRGVLPRWMMMFALATVIAFAVSALLFGLAFLLPASGAWRMPLVLVASIPGFVAWTAQPVWWLGVAATAR